jgi:hypothetical protein
MPSLGNDAFTLIWIMGGALLVVALFTLLGRKPASRRPARPGARASPDQAHAARK